MSVYETIYRPILVNGREKWFVHFTRMKKNRSVKQVSESQRGRRRKTWNDEVAAIVKRRNSTWVDRIDRIYTCLRELKKHTLQLRAHKFFD